MLSLLYMAMVSWMQALLLAPQSPRVVLPVKHDYFTTDNLGNMYLAREGELIKFTPDGRRFARYSDLRLGNISAVDATNPLKVVLYYQDYQQVVFLDNQLSVNGNAISLQELGLEQAALVCASVNNSFWVYERRNNELLRFDENARKVASTGNLRQVLGAEIAPVQMKEHNNLLYLNSPRAGIHVFDIYGAFTKLIPLREVTDLQVQESLLYYGRAASFCSYHQVSFEERCDSVAVARPVSTRVSNQRIYRSYRDSIVITPL
jgi:hypothetical protein